MTPPNSDFQSTPEKKLKGALDGVRVVDLSSVFLGPYCTHLLADMGADVIKVESIEGDSTRYIGPSRNPGMGPLFLHVNRNKRSIALNLKKSEGREVIRSLLKDADVFLTNVRGPALTRLGLDSKTLNAQCEKLIYCHAVGFSGAGPYANEPAFDDSIQGMSGLASLQGSADGRPQYMATVIADKVTGMMAAFAISSALFSRTQTGRGQNIEIPMFETMVSFTLTEHLYGRAFVPPMGDAVYPRLASKFRRPYKTKNGFIAVLPYLDAQWRRFFTLIEKVGLIEDTRFATMKARSENIDALYELVDNEMLTKTCEEWLHLLRLNDIPAVPVKSVGELLEDVHLIGTKFFKTVEHPTEGAILSMASPIDMSGTPAVVRSQAPHLGQHSCEVLLEIGYSLEEVQKLVSSGVV